MIRPYTGLRTICCNNPDLFVRMVLLIKGIKKKSLSARRTIHERFNSDHLEMMDDQMKQLIGLV